MTVTYKTIVINEPITTVSSSEEYGYYVSVDNVRELLKRYIDNSGEYDHIFVAYKLGEELHEEKIRTGDWIGLRRNGV